MLISLVTTRPVFPALVRKWPILQSVEVPKLALNPIFMDGKIIRANILVILCHVLNTKRVIKHMERVHVVEQLSIPIVAGTVMLIPKLNKLDIQFTFYFFVFLNI